MDWAGANVADVREMKREKTGPGGRNVAMAKVAGWGREGWTGVHPVDEGSWFPGRRRKPMREGGCPKPNADGRLW